MQAEPGDLLLFVADTFEVTCKALYCAAQAVRRRAEALRPARRCTFPGSSSFRCSPGTTRKKHWAAMHHPFTACRPQDVELLAHRSGQVPRQAYDLVINGSEAGGGTIRIHDQQMQSAGVRPAGHRRAEQARERFGFLLDALQFGAPPHGGIALGIDRWVMLLRRSGQHPRLHRLPQDAKSHRPDDRSPRPGRCEAIEGIGNQASGGRKKIAPRRAVISSTA